MIENFRIRFTQAFIVVILLIVLFSKSYFESNLPVISALLFFIGIVLAGFASLGRLWCSLYIAGYKTDKLVIQGPYSMSRNPLYFFSLLGAVGAGFATETFLIPLLILIVFSIYYPFVIISEEAELRSKHPNDFDSYYKSVPKFFPKISLLTEPREYIVRPVIFRKHMFDAMWFIWFIGILEIIEELHELGIMPTLFTLY